jgi:hypothetical protein
MADILIEVAKPFDKAERLTWLQQRHVRSMQHSISQRRSGSSRGSGSFRGRLTVQHFPAPRGRGFSKRFHIESVWESSFSSVGLADGGSGSWPLETNSIQEMAGYAASFITRRVLLSRWGRASGLLLELQ